MDEKMRRRIEALSRMTTKNGASSNEEQVAQRKMQLLQEQNKRQEEFQQRLNPQERTKIKVYPIHEAKEMHPQDVKFRNEFEELRKANRKKWGV